MYTLSEQQQTDSFRYNAYPDNSYNLYQNNDTYTGYIMDQTPHTYSFITPPASIESNEQMLSPSSSCSSSADTQMCGYLDTTNSIQTNQPYLRIIEQPVDGFRFRYKSEMTGTHGALGGASSSKMKKSTFPTVELLNYDKPAEIRCSLYQIGPEDKREPHAHRLVMKVGNEEKNDPHYLTVSKETGYKAIFGGMGIIHTARTHVVDELKRKKLEIRKMELEQYGKTLNKNEEVKIKNQAETMQKIINLNIVCLRFDAYVTDSNGVKKHLCGPVYSNKINNLKSALTGDLKIVRFSKASNPATGNVEVFLLVEKVTKKNIKIRFYEIDDNNEEIWSEYGHFNDIDVHHQYAIVFKPPPYKNLDIEHPVTVLMELERPSDGARSDPKEFRYTPCENYSRKRPRTDDSSLSSSDLPLTVLSSDMGDLSLSADLNKMIETGVLESFSSEFNEILKSNMAQEYGKVYDIDIPIQDDFLPNDYQNYNNQPYQIVAMTDYSRETVQTDAVVKKTPAQPKQKSSSNSATTSSRSAAPVSAPSSSASTVTSPLPKVISNPIPNGRDMEAIKNSKLQEDVAKIFKDIINLLKSRPTPKRVHDVLRSNLKKPLNADEDTILHLCTLCNMNKQLSFLFTLMKNFKALDLINIYNSKKETPFHLAAKTRNIALIKTLINLGANGEKTNHAGDNVLHLALKANASGECFQALVNYAKSCINVLNNDGDIPLFIAARSSNIRAIKILLEAGADPNITHKTTGYTALHIAVTEKKIGVIEELLKSPTLELVPDYTDNTALSLANILINKKSERGSRILNILEEYAGSKEAKKNVVFEMKHEIKEEVEEVYMSAEEDFEEIHLQVTTNEPNENSNMIVTKIEEDEPHQFTRECLDKLSALLDASKHWMNLADRLGHTFFLKHNLFKNVTSPSRAFLQYCMEQNDSIHTIRHYLSELGANEAVGVIDEMLKIS